MVKNGGGPSGAIFAEKTRCWWFELWPKGSEGAWRGLENFPNLPVSVNGG